MKAIIIIIVGLFSVTFAQVDEAYRLNDIEIYPDSGTTVIDISFSNLKGYSSFGMTDPARVV